MNRLAAALLLGTGIGPVTLAADPPPTVRFDRVVIDHDLAGAYQVEVADVDGDKRPDVVALGTNVIAWYQNPAWTKRIIGETKAGPLRADIISSATVDLDGDGRAEVAIACNFAMNSPTRGQLFLASQGATLDAAWTLRKVADVPSIHRVRWADLQADGKPELIVAPIFGPKARPPSYEQDPARVAWFRPGEAAPGTGHWTAHPILERPIVHAIRVEPTRRGDDGRIQAGGVMTADAGGVSMAMVQLEGPGAVIRGWEQGPYSLSRAATNAPRRGSSDINGGIAGGEIFFTTIDPWHGNELAVWHTLGGGEPPVVGTGPEATARRVARFLKGAGAVLSGRIVNRTVIDATLDDGHALWVADVDGDGADEIFAGHRGTDHRVSMYRREGDAWVRTVIDRDIAAQDLRGGDLDGARVPDVVAVGGSTHNVVWYRPTRLKGGPASTR